jgi:hypothetical protein
MSQRSPVQRKASLASVHYWAQISGISDKRRTPGSFHNLRLAVEWSEAVGIIGGALRPVI